VIGDISFISVVPLRAVGAVWIRFIELIKLCTQFPNAYIEEVKGISNIFFGQGY
jgi:hypothetical protein